MLADDGMEENFPRIRCLFAFLACRKGILFRKGTLSFISHLENMWPVITNKHMGEYIWKLSN
jgi:hypothetical protein